MAQFSSIRFGLVWFDVYDPVVTQLLLPYDDDTRLYGFACFYFFVFVFIFIRNTCCHRRNIFFMPVFIVQQKLN